MQHPYYSDAVINNAEFEITKRQKINLGFTKWVGNYKKHLTESDILAQVTGAKNGYTIRSIVFSRATDIAELSGAVSLHVKKAGTFTVNLILKHLIYADVALTGAEFEVNKLPRKNLRFPKWTLPYKSSITSLEIMRRITGPKDGYTIRNMAFTVNTDVAELTGIGNLSLRIKKGGTFNMNITLTHDFYQQVIIPAAEFEISKLPKRDLRFTKLTLAYKRTLSTQEILRQVSGLKDGYTIKKHCLPRRYRCSRIDRYQPGSGLVTEKSRYLCSNNYFGAFIA